MMESWINLIELFGNTEKLLCIISNKAGEIPREGAVYDFAVPISRRLEEIINSRTQKILNIEDLQGFVKNVQAKEKYWGVNFLNVGEENNTIEFRFSNGTIDADTWIENINLFGGIVRAAQDLALIQKKSETERTNEEQKMLDSLEKIKSREISEQEKLEDLLTIVIPEEDREIYRKRYNINKPLLEKENIIKEKLEMDTAKGIIDLRKVIEKVFFAEDSVTAEDYNQGIQIIESDLQRYNLDIVLE